MPHRTLRLVRITIGLQVFFGGCIEPAIRIAGYPVPMIRGSSAQSTKSLRKPRFNLFSSCQVWGIKYPKLMIRMTIRMATGARDRIERGRTGGIEGQPAFFVNGGSWVMQWNLSDQFKTGGCPKIDFGK